MTTIDLKSILQNTVSHRYGDLVTRRTGRAVRGGIEEVLDRSDAAQVAVIEFGDVRCLDISCADEIVGGLLRAHRARVFILRGVTEAHCDAISQVLERHDMVIAAQDRNGSCRLLGPLEDCVRRAFVVLLETGQAAAADVADRLAMSADATLGVLDELRERRLVKQEADLYRAIIT